jgi:hypothetical protein
VAGLPMNRRCKTGGNERIPISTRGPEARSTSLRAS